MRSQILVRTSIACALMALTLGAQLAQAQSRVQYGRITNAVVTTETSSTARNVGTVVGGTVGLVSGSGQSGSNRALRTIGGGAAGRGIGNVASRSQAFEYTVLINGTTTVRIISDQADKRVPALLSPVCTSDCPGASTAVVLLRRRAPTARRDAGSTAAARRSAPAVPGPLRSPCPLVS
jgi:outer membrane lipoprotein SlyB